MVTFCSNNRGLLWLSGRGGGGSNYILERCLHISKSYVSCLGKSMTLYFIYLLISWSHSSFHLFNQKSEKRKKTCCCRGKFRGIFVLFLPCTLLYSSIYGDFYLYMCKRPILKVSLWTEQSACGERPLLPTPISSLLSWTTEEFLPKMVNFKIFKAALLDFGSRTSWKHNRNPDATSR